MSHSEIGNAVEQSVVEIHKLNFFPLRHVICQSAARFVGTLNKIFPVPALIEKAVMPLLGLIVSALMLRWEMPLNNC